MKFGKLEIILSVIGGCCLLSTIPLVICMNHTTPRGDSANWLQAIVAILTLLGVIYAAIKASDAAKSTENVAHKANEISENSLILTERSYVVNILGYLGQQANNSLNRQTLATRRWRECQNIISAGGQPASSKAKAEQEKIFINTTKDKDISIFVTSILKCHHVIDSCKYKDSRYYKNILRSYLDTDAIIELLDEIQLQWVCKDYKSHGTASNFYKLALDFEKQYQDARAFLEIKKSS
ncbi:hypothetical protein [Komagataeibacter melaceti]|uniref:hypothetical protein n=1 Tax=Komagataeibacter melaceti TaxID=2766577 RepID=UPI0011E5A878|nr:hypothetical protein [Komagataeibacter melaceti]